MCRLKGKKGSMAIKIALHKAYDSVDWGFPWLDFGRFGVPGYY